MFNSDRTCCVCRERGKPVQLHHIDDDPANNQLSNLAVLCLDDHNKTQLIGGFDRKLDADQVILYRDDWVHLVNRNRSEQFVQAAESTNSDVRLSSITTEAEIYRENGEFEMLAILYNAIGNSDLRDKYVELALERDHDDGMTVFLRGVQGRPDLIPQDVLEREDRRLTEREDWTERGRMYRSIDRPVDAAKDYIKGINESLEQGNLFSAAFYAKEFEAEGLREALFIAALGDARERQDLWWEVRALQELEWRDELKQTLEAHKDEIEKSNDLLLINVLAQITGDHERLVSVRKEIAEGTRLVKGGVASTELETADQLSDEGAPTD